MAIVGATFSRSHSRSLLRFAFLLFFRMFLPRAESPGLSGFGSSKSLLEIADAEGAHLDPVSVSNRDGAAG